MGRTIGDAQRKNIASADGGTPSPQSPLVFLACLFAHWLLAPAVHHNLDTWNRLCFEG